MARHDDVTLMATFRTGWEALFLAVSANAGDPRAAPSFAAVAPAPMDVPAGVGIRDPALSPRMPDGFRYLAHTRIPRIGDDYNTPTGPVLGLLRSRDLVTWEAVGTGVLHVGLDDLTRCWAPKWFVDDDGMHLVFSGTDAATPGPFRFYEIHPLDTDPAGAWSAAQALVGEFPADAIDAYVVPRGEGGVLAAYKNRVTHTIVFARAPALPGPYALHGAAPESWGMQEGPVLRRLDDDGGWRLFFDWPANAPDNYRFADSAASDPGEGNWTGPRGDHGLVSSDAPLRHGTLATLDAAELRALRAALAAREPAAEAPAEVCAPASVVPVEPSPAWGDATLVVELGSGPRAGGVLGALGERGAGLGVWVEDGRLSAFLEHPDGAASRMLPLGQAAPVRRVALRLRNVALQIFVDGELSEVGLAADALDTYATRGAHGIAPWDTLRRGEGAVRVTLHRRALSDAELR